MRKEKSVNLVHINYGFIDEAAILKSSGVLKASDTIWCNGYLQHAFIPRPDWHPLSVADKKTLLRYNSTDILEEICVVCMSGSKYEHLKKISAIRSHDMNKDKNVEMAFCDIINDFVEISGEPYYMGIETTFDSAPTLTWEVDGRRTGLHVDSWSNRKIADRSRAPNRLCLNIGSGDRYLLFINRGIDIIRNELDLMDKLDRLYNENVTTLTSNFLTHMPESPVFAVRLRPGEAYIAPTEYIIHDGFVPGRLANTSISIMGYINLK